MACISLEIFSERKKIIFALPGNRTRVARMGILHDTTTPTVLLAKRRLL